MASMWKRIVVQCTSRGILMFTLIVLAILSYSLVKMFMAGPDPVDKSMSTSNYRTSNRQPGAQKQVADVVLEQHAQKPAGPLNRRMPTLPSNEERKQDEPKVERPEPPKEPPKENKPEEPPKQEKPEQPPKQEQPEAPPKQKQPEAPPKQEQPEEPPKQEQPEEPPKQEQPEQPPKQEQPEAPPKQEQPETPPKQEQPETPPKQEQPETPPKQEQPETPPKQEQPEEPPKQEQPEEPPKQEKSEEPPKQEQPEEPPKQEQPEEPPKQEQPEAPPKQKESEEPPKYEKPEQPQHEYLIEHHENVPLDPNEAQSVVRKLQQTGNTLLDHFLVNRPPSKPNRFASWVHLDLKGAAPKIDYLIELVPLLKKWGATGILIEYEDMFPWEKDVAIIKAPNAYSRDSLKRFIRVAKSNDLEVVPLIQTLGHMELLLKHESFQSLREDQRYPAFLNPAKPLSLVLLKVMIDQILEFHDDSNYIHIGGDEVYILGTSPESKARMQKESFGIPQLYLDHITTLAKYVMSKKPGVQTLIWDDMLRQMSVEDLKESNIAAHIEPVIWSYAKTVQKEITEQILNKYAQVFTNIWVGSAFKGASGSVQHLPDLAVHLQNHASWMEVIKNLELTHSNLKVQGIVLTGWSRYDHFSALCDLLPAAIPSLVAALQIIKTGTWNSDVIKEVSTLLQCTGPVFALDPETLHFSYAFEVPSTQELIDHNFNKQCSFPGDDVFYVILLYHQALKTFEKYFDPITGQTRGQCNRFSLGHSFINPWGVDTLCSGAAERVMKIFNFVDERVPVTFRTIYSDSVASEWLEEHVITFETWLEQYNTNVKSAASKSQVWGDRPNDPLGKVKGGTGLF